MAKTETELIRKFNLRECPVLKKIDSYVLHQRINNMPFCKRYTKSWCIINPFHDKKLLAVLETTKKDECNFLVNRKHNMYEQFTTC